MPYDERFFGPICEGPYQPKWSEIDRINQYPEWFNKAKFGIWAHWGPQAVGRDGDWYARYLYDPDCTHFKWNQYQTHLKNFGHPSQFGYKDILPLWKAEKWDPERLMKLYKKAGAKYFMGMGCHHDNFDCYDSRFQKWNSVNIGPKKDIVGIWQKEAEKNGLHFGASIHSDYSWWWWQTAFCSDNEGEYQNIPYDGGQNLSGKGEWWEGYDLKELYGMNLENECIVGSDRRRNFFNGIPERLKNPESIAFLEWFMKRWVDRLRDLIDHYPLDLLYLDGGDGDLYPFSGTGTGRGIKSDACERVCAHLYNTSIKRYGTNEAMLAIKTLKGNAILMDRESRFQDEISKSPWQQDITIGEWFYRPGFQYYTGSVIYQMLEVVSRNGNLLLNVPLTPEGDLDEGGEVLLEELADWMDICGEGIYDTTPWIKCLEGENRMPNGNLKDPSLIHFNQTDFRFTRKGDTVYAFCMTPPEELVTIKSFKDFTKDTDWGKQAVSVEILGSSEKPAFWQDGEGLHIRFSGKSPTNFAVCFKVRFLI